MLLPTLFDKCVVDVIGRVPVKALGNPLEIGLAVDRERSIFKQSYVHIL